MKIEIADNDTITAHLLNGNGPLRMEVRHGKNAPVRILGPSDYLIPPSKPSAGTTAGEWLAGMVQEDEGKIPAVVALGKLKPVRKFIAAAKNASRSEAEKRNNERDLVNDAIMTLHDAAQVLDIVVNSPIVTSEGDYAEQARQLKSLLWVLHPLIEKSSDTLYKWEMSR